MHHSLPTEFLDSLSGAPGFNRESFVRAHKQVEAFTSLRFNPAKCHEGQLPFTDTRKVPWSRFGIYLPERPSFTIDPLFHAGTYYVQEASSMFLEQAVVQLTDPGKPLKVLDLCAAPGGKSTHLLSLLPPGSLLVSNEIIKTRVPILSQNLVKWGSVCSVVTNNDPKDFQRLGAFFDVILVDAPCSGSGLFRRDRSAIDEWSCEAVSLCSQRQQRILSDILPALVPGGLLIYSTCSYSVEEDEAISDWLMDHHSFLSAQISVDPSWGITASKSAKHGAYGYRFYPDHLMGEGFFLTALRAHAEFDGNEESDQSHKGSASIKGLVPARREEEDACKDYIRFSDDVRLWTWQDRLYLFSESLIRDLRFLQQQLYVRKAGVLAGSLAKSGFVPEHDLSMSAYLSSSVPRIALDLEQSLQYLRKVTFPIEPGMKGWAIASYQQMPLGWMKCLPNRINNYYPTDWRILNK